MTCADSGIVVVADRLLPRGQRAGAALPGAQVLAAVSKRVMWIDRWART
jgi:hypothetical protein